MPSPLPCPSGCHESLRRPPLPQPHPHCKYAPTEQQLPMHHVIMRSAGKSWQDGRRILDIFARGPLLPLDVEAIERLMPRADLSVRDREGNTSLIRAASIKTCGLQIFSKLLAAGAPSPAANFSGATALSQASALCRLELVVALLSHGADPNASSDQSCAMPLIQACNCEAANAAQCAAVACALLRAGACPFACDAYCEPAIVMAAKLRRYDVVGVLLDACARSSAAPSVASFPQLLQQKQRSGSSNALMLLFGVDAAHIYVAYCRHMLAAHPSNSSRVSTRPPLAVPISGHFPAVVDTLPLAPQQRMQLLAAAASTAFHLICHLSRSPSHPSPSCAACRSARRSRISSAADARVQRTPALSHRPAAVPGRRSRCCRCCKRCGSGSQGSASCCHRAEAACQMSGEQEEGSARK